MIRQFDVLANPVASARRAWPFLLCVQHDNLSYLPFRLVAPLALTQVIREPSRLYPQVRVGRSALIFIPHDLTSRPVKQLGEPVASLLSERERIVAALDLVFTGI
ncbi:MAG TPA: CcdB family protein [Rhizomicrobium sp.]|jgi:toxin CcdB